jgi:hypothetical protein
MNPSRRCGIAFLAVSIVLTTFNVHNFLRRVGCDDCFFPYGVPFTLYTDGGYAGGKGMVWAGLVADVAIVVVASVVIGGLWQAIANKNSTQQC